MKKFLAALTAFTLAAGLSLAAIAAPASATDTTTPTPTATPTATSTATSTPADTPDSSKITFCHSDGRSGNYNRLRTSLAAFYISGHIGHSDDIFPAGSIIKHGVTFSWSAQGDQSLLQYAACVRPVSLPKDAAAAVIITPATCQAAASVMEDTTGLKFATWSPITYSNSGGTYSAVATAMSGHEFPDGAGVSHENTVKTFTGQLAAKTTGRSCEGYVIVAWQMPTWAGPHSPTWPQTLVTSQAETTPNLGALDAQLDATCGHQYQVDIYFDSTTTTSLIAGGHLDGPNNPAEDLITGSWGTAYKLVQGPACATPATPTEADVCAAAGGSITVTAVSGVEYYLNAAPIVFSGSTDVISGLTGTNTITASAAPGYRLEGYPAGGWSFTINTDCTAIFTVTSCTAGDNNSTEDVSLTIVNTSSTDATYSVATENSIATGAFGGTLGAHQTETRVLSLHANPDTTVTVTINDGDPIAVFHSVSSGCIPETPADPSVAQLSCTGATTNGGSISTDGNPDLTYTLTGDPAGFQSQTFPSNGNPSTISGLAAGNYVVHVTPNPGYVLAGASAFPFHVQLAAVNCTTTTVTPVVESAQATCQQDPAVDTSQFTAVDTQIQGTITIPASHPNMTFAIHGTNTYINPADGTNSLSDGTYSVVATLTAGAITDGVTFAASPHYVRSGGDTVATWTFIISGGCESVLPTWNASASATDAQCSARSLGTITLNHTTGQENKVRYVVTNDATQEQVYSGTDASNTVLHVAAGHYTVVASAVSAAEGISGDSGPYHLTVAPVVGVCGDSSLAFTGGTIAWLGFVLAGGMLFLGIAFLFIKRRQNRIAQ